MFDANVLFSAIGWGGTPGGGDLAASGHVVGLTCVEIMEELADRVRAKLHYGDEQIAHILTSLLRIMQVVPITFAMRGLQPDAKDDKLLECDVVGARTHVVTGDRRHLLPLNELRGARIVPPAEFLGEIKTAARPTTAPESP